jgi:hypothetical protein
MGIGDRSSGREAPQGDEQAIERYRYMLRTAPPDVIEQAHQEAFAQLTDRQRRMVLEELQKAAPEYERKARAGGADDPASLARMATRAEVRQPGTIERIFGGAGGMGGAGMGGFLAGTFLSSLAGTVIGSMIAQQFLAHGSGAEAHAAESLPDQGGYGTADDAEMEADGFDSDVGDTGDIDV